MKGGEHGRGLESDRSHRLPARRDSGRHRRAQVQRQRAIAQAEAKTATQTAQATQVEQEP